MGWFGSEKSRNTVLFQKWVTLQNFVSGCQVSTIERCLHVQKIFCLKTDEIRNFESFFYQNGHAANFKLKYNFEKILIKICFLSWKWMCLENIINFVLRVRYTFVFFLNWRAKIIKRVIARRITSGV